MCVCVCVRPKDSSRIKEHLNKSACVIPGKQPKCASHFKGMEGQGVGEFYLLRKTQAIMWY